MSSDKYQQEFLRKMKTGTPIEVPGMKEVAAQRNLELHGLHVDVAKRDKGDNTYAWNIIVRMTQTRVMPGKIAVSSPGDVSRVGDAVGRVCRRMFGDQKNVSELFDFFFMDQREIAKRLGSALDNFNNFCVEIKWPASQLYALEDLKDRFMRLLSEEMSRPA